MDLKDLRTGLAEILPTVYGKWGRGNAPTLPYVVLLEAEPDIAYADDKPLLVNTNMAVELYFDAKDPDVEKQLESFFNALELGWSCGGDSYIDTDDFYERIYYVEIGE